MCCTLRRLVSLLSFEQVKGPWRTTAPDFAMNQLDVVLKGLAEDKEVKDLLFMAAASRSAADISRAIAAAKAAGFTVYQAPSVAGQKKI
jgi:hypothetical protein